ncbi:MAG: DUF5995 family protein [Anaerolineae bacterium]|nr:DUF5995 family protein [Anaerolineae bacterium]
MSLYRMVTVLVKERCDEGNFFEDNDRMRLLDVLFANRYFDALDAHLNGGTPTKSWAISFEMAEKEELLILQQLLLGMNAHIALDLGIAAAEVSGGELTPSLERDFNRLNNLLAGLIDTVQDEVGAVSPLLRYMDKIALRADENFVSFSINIARDNAWKFAQTLAPMSPENRVQKIIERDTEVAGFARNTIASTSFPFGIFVWFVNLRESKDTLEIIKVLSNDDSEKNIKKQVYRLLRRVEEQGLDLSNRDTQLFRIPKEFSR